MYAHVYMYMYNMYIHVYMYMYDMCKLSSTKLPTHLFRHHPS